MLTWVERLTLWNQYEILKRVDAGNAKSYEANQDILENGYEQYYSELNTSISTETVPQNVTREVENILNLFRFIKFSCNRLNYQPKSTWAHFDGFDGNETTGHYGFAQFLRRKLGKWEELKDRPDNSHSSVSLDRYRLMLKRWQMFDKRAELTEAEIEEIAAFGP